MFERFTDKARRGVVLAQEECRHRGHREIDVGHIALGALKVSEGAGLGPGTVNAVRRGIESTFTGRTIDHGSHGHIPFTPAATAAFERSLQMSLQDGRKAIDSRDILLAALDQPRLGPPLNTAGLDLELLRSTIAASRFADPEAV